MKKTPKIKKYLNRFKPEYIRACLALLVLCLVGWGIYESVLYTLNVSQDMELPLEFAIDENGRALPIDKVKKSKAEEVKTISLDWTDDNTNENLIIQTDEKTYYGFNRADIYFSITNISRRSQIANIDFLFRDKSVKLLSLESLSSREELDLTKPNLIII